MEKIINIDGKAVALKATAAVPRMYRIKFHRDIIQDFNTLEKQMKRAEREKRDIGIDSLELFENLAYIMAKHARPSEVPSSVDEWLEGFETFSIYTVFPEMLDLWNLNTLQLETPKKN